MGGKKISDLRVVELRSQLEKRGLDTKGNKAALVERLSTALANEGEGAEDYLMRQELEESKDKAPMEEDQPSGDVAEGEGQDENDSEKSELGPIINVVSNSKLMEVDDDNRGDSEETDLQQDKEMEDEEEEEESGSQQPDKISQVSNEKSVIVETPAATITSVPDDDHDALNLTIGEEEDKFMMDGEDQEVSVIRIRAVPKSGANSTKTDDSSIPADCDKTPSAEINDTQSDSIDGKRNEKSEEGGKLHRKSKADDRNTLLVTGLSSQTAATEIKAVFKRHGKIGGVKIMSNAKDPEGSRFALVSVISSEDALICIQNLDGFELHGRIIHVDKARAEMLSADWVRKEGSRDHSKSRKDSKKSPPNGSTTSSNTATPSKTTTDGVTDNVPVSERPSTSSSDTARQSEPLDKETSASQKSNEETMKMSPKAAPTPDTPSTPSTSHDGKKEDAKPSSVKKDVDKKSTPRRTPEKRPSTEKRETTRKDVIPLQRNYHFQRRPGQPFHRDSRMMRNNPKFRHYDQDSRDEYHHHRRPYHHDEDRMGHHHHRMVRRSRSPQERMVRRSRSPQERMVRRSRSPPERMVRRSRSPQERMIRRTRSPPERIPYNHRGTPESGRQRMGRQPELTFEEIYDTRQREKDREMERERREVERRRLEEAEKQRLLDEEFRRLARERERIEAEKAELKRQKEKMIMEEREKQRLDQAELEREKAILARKLKNKRSHLGDDFARNDQKKQGMDDRSRHGGASYGDTASLRMGKETAHSSQPYRRVEATSRYPTADSGSPMRGAPLRSAPVRDRRSPSWENDRRKREVKATERPIHRERDQTKFRDETKFPVTTPAADKGNRYNTYDSSAHYSTGASANQSGRIVTAITKPIGSYYSGSTSGSGRDDNRWQASTSSFLDSNSSRTVLSSSMPTWDDFQAKLTADIGNEGDAYWKRLRATGGRPDPFQEDADRIAWALDPKRPRLGLPVAPPPPVFSTATEELTMNSISGNSFNTNVYSTNYDYKLSSIPSHRR